MNQNELHLPIVFSATAVFFFALTGALTGRRIGCDIVGIFTLALATGLGGGLIRDALLRGSGPVLALTEPWFIFAVLAATLCGLLRFTARLDFQRRTLAMFDAVGLGAFTAVGVDMALQTRVHWAAAVLVGMANAVGGGLLRDLLTRVDPLLLKPGQFYVLAALLGALVYVELTMQHGIAPTTAAIWATAATVALRMLAILFNWKTNAVEEPLTSP